jgi:hypothetical protein
MKEVEKYIKEIKGNKATMEKKDSVNLEESKEGEKLQASEKDAKQKEDPVPIEYFAINLMNFNATKE